MNEAQKKEDKDHFICPDDVFPDPVCKSKQDDKKCTDETVQARRAEESCQGREDEVKLDEKACRSHPAGKEDQIEKGQGSQKKAEHEKKAARLDSLFRMYPAQASSMAPVGQTLAHVPQSMHFSASIE